MRTEPFQALEQWLDAHEALLWGLGGISLLMFVGTLIALPMIVVRLPRDYLLDRPHTPRGGSPLRHTAYLVGKNLLGIVFILAGLAMLVLPGQGILSLVIGLSLTSFPGKQALLHRLLRQKSVLRTMNWLREKAGRPPFSDPGHPAWDA